jgi:putative drug exporter of the RND superfamily
MDGIARWCFAHRKVTVAGWLAVLVTVVALGFGLGSRFDMSFSLPGTDSQAAVSLLTKNFPAASGEGDQVVIQATGGASICSPQVRSAVTGALAEVARLPGVEAVGRPYSATGGAQISRDGTIAFATVTWDKQTSAVTRSDATHLINAAGSADRGDVRISVGGQAISNSEIGSTGLLVAVGVVAALVILLIVFGGALLSSLMPLATVAVALVIGTSVIRLLTHLFKVPAIATDRAVLIGLGVGVDYGLFIISRHRGAVRSGLSYGDAAAQAVRTSGRTVLFAGITVCIALLGQLFLGVGFLYGLSVSAAIAVALTMATSLTFLPAMLGFLGPKVLSRRERRALTAGGPVAADAGGNWLRWAKFIEARRIFAGVGALAVVAVIAVPVLGLRLGTSDAATSPASSTTRQAYNALARGFGPGFNGPFELAGQIGSSADAMAFDRFVAAAGHLSGVASVTSPVTSPNGKAALSTLYPATSPQAPQTIRLVNHLREQLIPTAEKEGTLVVHVGGATATNIDFSHVLTDKLPLFIAVVVALAFVLLMAVFRSLLIPLVASVMNLLSAGAAFGALNAVFNWGWGSPILRLSGTGPIDAWVPVLMFSVLFGLSMDYEVYLVSRIQEEWHRLHQAGAGDAAGPADTGKGRNQLAVTTGQASSGQVIAAAAGIMILVFGSFILGGERQLQEFGFGLAFSVLVDALVIRGLLVPAIMHLAGPSNWSIPAWLDRILPSLAIETRQGQPPVNSDPLRVP